MRELGFADNHMLVWQNKHVNVERHCRPRHEAAVSYIHFLSVISTCTFRGQDYNFPRVIAYTLQLLVIFSCLAQNIHINSLTNSLRKEIVVS